MSDDVKHVLVTGAGGFVGSHLLQSLASTPWDITVIDSFRYNGITDRVTNALLLSDNHIALRQCTMMTHDLMAPLSPLQVEKLRDVDVILDIASRPSVDESIRDPRDFILNNVAVTLTTLELARQVHPSRYIHLSTDEVYGPSDQPCSVTDHQPSTPYSASKAAQDDICVAYAQTYGIPLTIVCASNMFGERQSQLAFIPRIIRAALDDSVITVHVANSVPGQRNYNYVADVADWLVELIADYDTTEWPSRLGFPGRYTVNNAILAHIVWRAVHDLVGSCRAEPRIELKEVATLRPSYDRSYAPITEHDPAWLHAANLKNAPFEDRIERTVRWFCDNPEWLQL